MKRILQGRPLIQFSFHPTADESIVEVHFKLMCGRINVLTPGNGFYIVYAALPLVLPDGVTIKAVSFPEMFKDYKTIINPPMFTGGTAAPQDVYTTVNIEVNKDQEQSFIQTRQYHFCTIELSGSASGLKMINVAALLYNPTPEDISNHPNAQAQVICNTNKQIGVDGYYGQELTDPTAYPNKSFYTSPGTRQGHAGATDNVDTAQYNSTYKNWLKVV